MEQMNLDLTYFFLNVFEYISEKMDSLKLLDARYLSHKIKV